MVTLTFRADQERLRPTVASLGRPDYGRGGSIFIVIYCLRQETSRVRSRFQVWEDEDFHSIGAFSGQSLRDLHQGLRVDPDRNDGDLAVQNVPLQFWINANLGLVKESPSFGLPEEAVVLVTSVPLAKEVVIGAVLSQHLSETAKRLAL